MNTDQLAKALEIERKKRIAAQNDAVLQNLQTELLKQAMNKEQMRFEAAKAAMQGLLTNPYWDECDFGRITKAAVNAADCLLQAFYPSTEESSAVADSEGWIAHKPGDPMPCDEDLMVWVRFADCIQDKYNYAGFSKGVDGSISFWNECGDETIIAWKPQKLNAVEILNQFVKP